MAGRQVSCFDRLPDELLANILGRTTNSYSKDWLKWGPYEWKNLLRAQEVCKRWYELTYSVDSLFWPVSTVQSAAAMGRFLLCDRQNVKMLSIRFEATQDIGVLFNLILGTVRNRLPPELEIWMHDDVEISAHVEELFYSRSIKSLTFSSTYYISFCNLPRASMHSSSQITQLTLSYINAPSKGLQSLISLCPLLERLSWNRVWHETDAVFSSASLVEMDVVEEDDCDPQLRCIEILAPRLRKLRAGYGRVSLDCPELEHLTFLKTSKGTDVPLEATSLQNLQSAKLHVSRIYGINILFKCPNLQSLEVLSDDQETGCNMDLGDLLKQLPQHLELLVLKGKAMKELLPPRPEDSLLEKLGRRRLGVLRELRVEMSPSISNYVTLRCLVIACPNLERLLVLLSPDERILPKDDSLRMFSTLLRGLDYQNIQVDVQPVEKSPRKTMSW
jgi:hypothetical protein